jgi:hypothetical protein
MSNSIAAQFFHWYFLEFPMQILHNGRNFMVWCWRFFSIGFFSTRIFSPWHKDITSYGIGFDIQVWAKAMVWNMISRMIGACLRLFFMIFGIALEFFIAVFTLAFFIGWYAILGLIILLFII